VRYKEHLPRFDDALDGAEALRTVSASGLVEAPEGEEPLAQAQRQRHVRAVARAAHARRWGAPWGIQDPLLAADHGGVPGIGGVGVHVKDTPGHGGTRDEPLVVWPSLGAQQRKEIGPARRGGPRQKSQ